MEITDETGIPLPFPPPDSKEQRAKSKEPESPLRPTPYALRYQIPAGYRVFKEFSGTRLDITQPIVWDGRADDGRLVQENVVYKYVLSVESPDDIVDYTPEGQFIVVSTWSEAIRKALCVPLPPERVVFQPVKAIGIVQQEIPVPGRLYRITGSTDDSRNEIRVSTADLPDIIRVEPFEDGTFETEVYIPIGERDLVVESITPDRSRKIRLTQDLKVPEEPLDYTFLVALGDLQIGSNSTEGVLDAIKHNKKLDEGSYSDGRFAYYLKAKRDKWYITSSLDTAREEKAMFRYIDPDKFYPIYGDASVRKDEVNTQGAFFLKVDYEKSSAMYGNYHTGFTGTELAQYNRSLYGLKSNIQLPTSNLTVFAATAKQLACHDELRATGGSLYYLRHKEVLEGSEKVSIQTRDKISGLVSESRVMSAGEDYEIDYDAGRIIFYKPVASVAPAETMISRELLEGNKVYVVVDYEYEPDDYFRKGSFGGRIIQHLGELGGLGEGVIGTTFVKEEKGLEDYSLLGTDIKLSLGRHIRLAAEYASSESEGVPGFISYNGGLNFTSLPTLAKDEGTAYKVNLDTDLGGLVNWLTGLPVRRQTGGSVDRWTGEVMFQGYYQQIEKGFSSGASIFNQGTTKFGLGINARITSQDSFSFRFDNQKLEKAGNTASQNQLGASETETANLQYQHIADPLKFTAGYQYQSIKKPVTSPLLSKKAEDSHMLALRADYRLNDKISVFVEQQGALKGFKNHQTSFGASANLPVQLGENTTGTVQQTVGKTGNATTASLPVQLGKNTTGTIQQTVGKMGNATAFAISSMKDEKTTLYTTYQITEDPAGKKTFSMVFGEKTKVSERMSVYREERFTGRSGAENALYGGLFGADYALNQHWGFGLTYERSQVSDGADTSRDAATFGVTYISHPERKDPRQRRGSPSAATRIEGYLKLTSRLELRTDESTTRGYTEYLYANKAFCQVNRDLSLLVKAYLSETQNDKTNKTEAKFTEISIGTAYRPVKHDRYNFLAKVSYQEDQSPEGQGDLVLLRDAALIFSLEGVMDLSSHLELVEKLAYKQVLEEIGTFKGTESDTYLVATRLNYKIKSDTEWLNNWKAGVEYRQLVVELAEDQKAGWVIEFDRELGKVEWAGIVLGLGYNFTDFSDDLSIYNDEYEVGGWFIRITAKY